MADESMVKKIIVGVTVSVVTAGVLTFFKTSGDDAPRPQPVQEPQAAGTVNTPVSPVTEQSSTSSGAMGITNDPPQRTVPEPRAVDRWSGTWMDQDQAVHTIAVHNGQVFVEQTGVEPETGLTLTINGSGVDEGHQLTGTLNVMGMMQVPFIIRAVEPDHLQITYFPPEGISTTDDLYRLQE